MTSLQILTQEEVKKFNTVPILNTKLEPDKLKDVEYLFYTGVDNIYYKGRLKGNTPEATSVYGFASREKKK